ncbi:transcription factor MafG-like [Centruroides sculpturatus]|uniref:transcription factor MafG-like n=1 Tax=Centruroides sculpturatus TaxID=218467 RepID=UPI000C6D4045|nr:transcription factor MafG-like [Centruroides sculpturatus]
MENNRERLLSDEELMKFSTPFLNRLIKLYEYNEEEILLMKQRRKTLKNHGYAVTSREQIHQRIEYLEKETEKVKSEISQLQQQKIELTRNIRDVHESILSLKSFAEIKNIRLPDDCDTFIYEVLRDFSQAKEFSSYK